jgi:hypothetical protein
MNIKVDAKKHIIAKTQLNDILFDVSWARISREYFGKSSSWIYNKLDGIDGNGGYGEFTETEKIQLKGALCDIAKRIRIAADNFD